MMGLQVCQQTSPLSRQLPSYEEVVESKLWCCSSTRVLDNNTLTNKGTQVFVGSKGV